MVRKGDTLQGLAAGLYGDASLWYKIADANGLSGNTALIEGQSLTLPAGVIRNTNNASTFQPYDPASTIGDVSPTTGAAAPPKKKGCGASGQILLAIIAVAVALVVAPYALGAAATAGAPATGLTAFFGGAAATGAGAAGVAATVTAGALAGAAGSIASQAFGVATGIQEKFSWKAVALAAIGGGVGAGFGGAFRNSISNPALQAMARGAAASAITQGIGVVTGLQDKFSWAGVAAAGIGAGVGAGVAKRGISGGNFTDRLIRSGASAIGNAATRSLIEGSDFGDNVLAALPDVIGGAIGESIGGAVLSGIERSAQQAELRASFSGNQTPEVIAALNEMSASAQSGTVSLQKTAYKPNQSFTADEVVAILTSGTTGLDATGITDTIKVNIQRFVDTTGSAAQSAGSNSITEIALAKNSALLTTYSAIGLTMPNFQWTMVGAFMAFQVRGQIISVSNQASIGSGVAGGVLRPPLSSTAQSLSIGTARYIIRTLIDGQIGVVTDLGSLALGYKTLGRGILQSRAVRRDPVTRQASTDQIAADAAYARGDHRAAGLLGLTAAKGLGIREQSNLQTMWNDPILKGAAQTMSRLGLLDTRVRTVLGVIRAPSAAKDVTKLEDRIQIANNAFEYMHDKLYSGRVGQDQQGHNWGHVKKCFQK